MLNRRHLLDNIEAAARHRAPRTTTPPARSPGAPSEIKYPHHEMDPVLMRGLVFINGHWQGMSYALAFTEAKLMTKDDFYKALGTTADHHRQTLGR
jgi:hypothetical protein